MIAPSRRSILLGCAVLLLAAGFTRYHAVQADPHAVFYTAIGQQQLFFNVLAALDQADYVESKQLRDELLKKREATGFLPETKTSPTGTTRSDLANVLSRSVTLEGDDLWTAYLANQFAIEAARRRNTDEVLRIYCERGLGREGCKDDNTHTKDAEELKEKAFVVDPVERSAQGALNGLEGTIGSSTDTTSEDQKTRREITDPNNKDPKAYPFDPYVAQLEKESTNNSLAKKALDRLRAGTRAAFAPNTINPTAYNELKPNNQQEATLPRDPDESPEVYITRYMENVGGLLAVSNQFQESAQRGIVAVQAGQDAAESEGALADTVLPPNTDKQGYIKDLTPQIDVPAYAKAGTTKEAINTLANTEQNLAYAPSQAESVIGTQELVERGAANPAPAQPAANGQAVLGTVDIDPEFDPTHNQNLTKQLTPGTNPAGFHHEQGAAHLLKALGYQADRGGCGCSVNAAANDFGQAIIRRINGK